MLLIQYIRLFPSCNITGILSLFYCEGVLFNPDGRRKIGSIGW